VDAYSAILIFARTTKIPLLFMDPSDAGAIHVCRKLGWEFTKAHELWDEECNISSSRENDFFVKRP